MHHSLYRPPSMLQTNENICLESLEAREALQLGLNCKKRKQPCLTYSKSHKFKYKVTFVTDTVKTIANQRNDVASESLGYRTEDFSQMFSILKWRASG